MLLNLKNSTHFCFSVFTFADLLSIASDIMVVQATAETSLKVLGSFILAANNSSGEVVVALSKTLAGLDTQETSDNVKQILSKVIDVDRMVKDIDAKLDGKVPRVLVRPGLSPPVIRRVRILAMTMMTFPRRVMTGPWKTHSRF